MVVLWAEAPYGVYDGAANRGVLVVASCHDSSDFAADNWVRWWRLEALERDRDASELLVLSDSGRQQQPGIRCFRYALQTLLGDPFLLLVAVCHYSVSDNRKLPNSDNRKLHTELILKVVQCVPRCWRQQQRWSGTHDVWMGNEDAADALSGLAGDEGGAGEGV